MLNRPQKEEQVSLLREKITAAQALVAVDYRGLNVTESNVLRAKLREAGEGRNIEYRVAKNTLVKLALEGTANQPLQSFCSGPTAVAFAFDEPAILAKILVEYSKEFDKFKIKGVRNALEERQKQLEASGGAPAAAETETAAETAPETATENS